MHVELDPLAEVQVRQAIEDKQMRVVGWYHSHPVFAPQPSLRDVQNQTNYQYLFHDPLVNMMPFIGVIVSPFDSRTSSASSAITMFYVENSSGAAGRPMRCNYCTCRVDAPTAAAAPSRAGGGAPRGGEAALQSPRQNAKGQAAEDAAPPRLALLAAALPAGEPELEHELRATCRILCALVHYYKRNRSRTPMQAAWRQRQPKSSTTSGAGAAGAAVPSSKLDKLRRSVRGRLVESFSHDVIDAAIGDVCRIIEAHWNK